MFWDRMLLTFMLYFSDSAVHPDDIQVIDPAKNQVVREFSSTDRMTDAVNLLLRNRKPYVGISIPEGLIIKIGFRDNVVMRDRTSAISITDLYIIKGKKHTVMLLFDRQNRPRVFAANDRDAQRLSRMMSLD
ncbi:hypothetical protein GE107_11455 [Cohnella sp. CFH 77786]|uniref:hypothetical protein n=1 Tax=Cohnella sp. CFH 77786 TaxID=2662265 RepID=UPI001C60CC6A|nr:hypothetical protein [Cohnella sp. CFH 77786]MBW5446677.1 hypothetical protein [Cohnella sp. CFH 77786]